LAQVQQPPDSDLGSVQRKLNYDIYYVDWFSAWLDVRIAVATVLKCLGVPFGVIGRALQLPDPNDGDTRTRSTPPPSRLPA
jgi:hypothetical protein